MSSSSNVGLVLSYCLLRWELSCVYAATFMSWVCRTCRAGEREGCPAALSAPGCRCRSTQQCAVYAWVACLWHGLGVAAFVLNWIGSRHGSVKVRMNQWLYWRRVKVCLAPNPILAVVDSSLWKSPVTLVQDTVLQLIHLLYLACIVSSRQQEYILIHSA